MKKMYLMLLTTTVSINILKTFFLCRQLTSGKANLFIVYPGLYSVVLNLFSLSIYRHQFLYMGLPRLISYKTEGTFVFALRITFSFRMRKQKIAEVVSRKQRREKCQWEWIIQKRNTVCFKQLSAKNAKNLWQQAINMWQDVQQLHAIVRSLDYEAGIFFF